ncbi:MAG: hypothetical protein ACXIUZ_06155 [Lysobacteraceae bacterium]
MDALHSGLRQAVASAFGLRPALRRRGQPAQPEAFAFQRCSDTSGQAFARVGAELARASDGVARRFREAASPEALLAACSTVGDWSGLDPDNLLDVLAVFWVELWSASRMAPRPTRLLPAVRAQLHIGLRWGHALRAGGDATLQLEADTLLFHAVLLDGLRRVEAPGDPSVPRALARHASWMAIRRGIDLSRLALTPHGLLPTPRVAPSLSAAGAAATL